MQRMFDVADNSNIIHTTSPFIDIISLGDQQCANASIPPTADITISSLIFQDCIQTSLSRSWFLAGVCLVLGKQIRAMYDTISIPVFMCDPPTDQGDRHT